MFFAEAQRENGLKRSREVVRHTWHACCSLEDDKCVKRREAFHLVRENIAAEKLKGKMIRREAKKPFAAVPSMATDDRDE
jgi:hypothetical protein